jgi:hypothetical protein
MTTPGPHPERRSSSYPAHYRGTDTTAVDAHVGLSGPFTVPPADRTDFTSQSTNSAHDAHSGHGGHGLMMLVCCIPMVAVVVLLILSGTASAGALVWALGCVVMMAAMMFLMPGGHGQK